MFDADPHGIAAEYRASSAALYDHEQQAWLVLRHVDVASMLRDPNLSKDPAAAIDGPYTRAFLGDDHSILFMDDPDLRRLRGMVSHAFSKRATEASRPRIQTITDAILGSIRAEAESVDIVSSDIAGGGAGHVGKSSVAPRPTSGSADAVTRCSPT